MSIGMQIVKRHMDRTGHVIDVWEALANSIDVAIEDTRKKAREAGMEESRSRSSVRPGWGDMGG